MTRPARPIELEELIGLLAHDDADVVALAIEIFREMKSLDTLAVDQWLELVEKANPSVLEAIVELLERFVDSERVTLAQVVRLARCRRLPVARVGLEWLATKVPQHAADDALVAESHGGGVRAVAGADRASGSRSGSARPRGSTRAGCSSFWTAGMRMCVPRGSTGSGRNRVFATT